MVLKLHDIQLRAAKLSFWKLKKKKYNLKSSIIPPIKYRFHPDRSGHLNDKPYEFMEIWALTKYVIVSIATLVYLLSNSKSYNSLVASGSCFSHSCIIVNIVLWSILRTLRYFTTCVMCVKVIVFSSTLQALFSYFICQLSLTVSCVHT